MARRRVKPSVRKGEFSHSMSLRDANAKPTKEPNKNIARKQLLKPMRRSERLRGIVSPYDQLESVYTQASTAPTQAQPSSPTLKRRRADEHCQTLNHKADRSRKRVRRESEDHGEDLDHNGNQVDSDPVLLWARTGSWPKEYFKQDDETRKIFDGKDCIIEEIDEEWFRRKFGSVSKMSNIFARPKTPASLRRMNSGSGNSIVSGGTPSDQKPREVKSAPYIRPSYETILATKGSFLVESDLGLTVGSETLCSKLLEKEQDTPRDSMFRDEVFQRLCVKIRNRNEAMVIQDISRLIVPSAQNLAICGAVHLNCLIESVNEGWNGAIPFYHARPQPDYSVGFARAAFTNEQLEKLTPFVGEIADSCTSFFMATWQMYFPFLTCEVKCGAAGLDVADRQNAHSMTVAVRGVVELFRYVKRETELHREVLAFSISHDHESVRIYGHYALIDGIDTKFYRHRIKAFYFTEPSAKERWTAYKFTKNVYDIWMPAHLKKICSAIDDLPDLDFEVSRQSELQFEDEPNPQTGIETEDSLQSDTTGQSSLVDSQQVTPNTSVTEKAERAYKKPKSKR